MVRGPLPVMLVVYVETWADVWRLAQGGHLKRDIAVALLVDDDDHFAQTAEST